MHLFGHIIIKNYMQVQIFLEFYSFYAHVYDFMMVLHTGVNMNFERILYENFPH